jgi:hypothetical protein
VAERREKRKLFTRRILVKTLSGLFAFIPAIKYLADASPAFAVYECEYTICGAYNPPIWECMDPECTGRYTWYQFQGCMDAYTGNFCFNVWVDSEQEC